MKNFRLDSIDPERLFSLVRLSKNYLQNRLSAENYSGIVFLNKIKSNFLYWINFDNIIPSQVFCFSSNS